MELLNIKSVDMLREPPKIGDIVMCGGCGFPNKVTLQGTELLTKEEFDALPLVERNDLTFAARAITKQIRSN
jgi:hypothetical protein